MVGFAWTGRLDDANALWFDLSLRTADYDEEGDPPEDPEGYDAWISPIVWNNYHCCFLSSTKWEDATGLLAATPERPFRFTDPRPQRLTADPLPVEDLDAQPAFHIYLLGHDSVAGHEVEFTRQDAGGFSIAWTGRIALTYTGDEEFRHGFRAEIRDAALGPIRVADGMPVEEARRRLTQLIDIPLVDAPHQMAESELDGHRVLMLPGP